MKAKAKQAQRDKSVWVVFSTTEIGNFAACTSKALADVAAAEANAPRRNAFAVKEVPLVAGK